MSEIVNNNNLILILTDYGLSRIAEAIHNPALNLTITKIKLGSGDNFEYYEPSAAQESLKGDLGLEFYVYDKNLLEDGVTISFHTIIPEIVGGFDIREVGLYETVDGVDKLFAISTQQPFVKPSPDTYHFISIDYYMFIKSVNFAAVYSQIVLDADHTYISERDMEELMRTFLWAHSNLINQEGNNSKIIGYNRATQLYEKIAEDKKSFSYLNLYRNFSNLQDALESSHNILFYWVFDNSRRKNLENSILDLSEKAQYLTTSVPLTSLKHSYNGFMSMFSFERPNYFSLSSQIPFNMYDPDTLKDYPFTMIFALEPLDTTSSKTLIAKSNYSTGTHSFEVSELSNGSLEIKLFSDNDNYLTFTSTENAIPDSCHSLVITYNPTDFTMIAYINASKLKLSVKETGTYTHINETPGTLYAFTCTPTHEIYTDNPYTPTVLFNEDGTRYNETNWNISINTVIYKGNVASYTPIKNTVTDKLYAWIPTGTQVFERIVYTKTQEIAKDTILYNRYYEVQYQDGSPFSIVPSGDTYVILYNGYQTERYAPADVNPATLYCFQYTESTQTIWANNSAAPQILYNSDNSIYTGSEWTIDENFVFYEDFPASYNENENIETFNPDLTSYIVDSSGNITNYINSKVGLISIIKEHLSENNARALALNLIATMGKNPYFGGF